VLAGEGAKLVLIVQIAFAPESPHEPDPAVARLFQAREENRPERCDSGAGRHEQEIAIWGVVQGERARGPFELHGIARLQGV